MASWKSLDKRMRRDEKALHDFLWHPGEKASAEGLLENLAAEAKELDAHLKAGGKLSRHAASLADATAKKRAGSGESLFELLSHTYNLTAATEHVRAGDLEGAADHLEDAMGSVTIGVCANAGCFRFVEEWESGAVGFEAYMAKLADHLEGKGIANAGEWKRLVSAGYHLKRTLEAKAPDAERALAARAAIGNACYAALASLTIRKALGTAPRYPYGDFAAVVGKIAARV